LCERERTKLSQTTWDNGNNVGDPRRAQFSVADSQMFVEGSKGSLACGDLRSTISARVLVGVEAAALSQLAMYGVRSARSRYYSRKRQNIC
jgi:hypothetical protein